MPRSEISEAELNLAGVDGLAVLGREELQELIATIGEEKSISSTIRFVLGKIPSHPSSPGLTRPTF